LKKLTVVLAIGTFAVAVIIAWPFIVVNTVVIVVVAVTIVVNTVVANTAGAISTIVIASPHRRVNRGQPSSLSRSRSPSLQLLPVIAVVIVALLLLLFQNLNLLSVKTKYRRVLSLILKVLGRKRTRSFLILMLDRTLGIQVPTSRATAV
jgi:hypothetical protein